MSALGGFVLAVCSCTIMPLFASIYKKGAGLDPAITFLFVGPAVNVLAITFTGAVIGMDIAIARIILSVVFGVGIGMLMAWFFREDDRAHNEATTGGRAFFRGATVPAHTWVFFILLLGVVVAGTLQVGLLTSTYATCTVPGSWAIAGVVAGSIALLAVIAVWTDRHSRRAGTLASQAKKRARSWLPVPRVA